MNNYKERSTPLELVRIFRFFMIGTFSALLFLGLFSREILIIFTTPLYYDASNVVLLISCSLFLSGMYVFAPGLWLAKKTKYIAIINVIGAVLNIFLVFLLIPIWGIVGAALATLVSALIIFIINQVFSQRNYPIPYPWKNVIITTLIMTSFLIICWKLSENTVIWLAILIKFIFGSIGVIIVMQIFSDKDELSKMYNWICSQIKELIVRE